LHTASPFSSARLEWRKASRSTGSGNDCVELSQAEGMIGVRDSKMRDAQGRNVSHVFELTRTQWRSLSERIKSQNDAPQF
jgi:hypothetical protein